MKMTAMTRKAFPAVEIIAHRGASFEAPENTLASFKLGWTETQTVELDVWPTSDGKLLVIHDGNTQRTTGVDRNVTDHPLAELSQLDAGSFKGAKWSAEKLPSLQDVLAAIPPGRRLLIEIKTGAEVIAELRREVDASGKWDQILHPQLRLRRLCGSQEGASTNRGELVGGVEARGAFHRTVRPFYRVGPTSQNRSFEWLVTRE